MHFLAILCFVPVILDRPGSLWNAHSRPHKESRALWQWNSSRPSSPAGACPPHSHPAWLLSKQLSRGVVPWSGLPPTWQPGFELVLQMNSYTMGLSTGVCTPPETRKSFPRDGWTSEVIKISFQILSFYMHNFLKLILPKRNLLKKNKLLFLTFSFISPFLPERCAFLCLRPTQGTWPQG